MLAILDADALRIIIDMVGSDDRLPLALTCKAVHAVCRDRVDPRSPPLWVTGGTVTLARVRWAVDSMKATPSCRWCIYAKRHGHTEALLWMQSNGVVIDARGMVAVSLWG